MNKHTKKFALVASLVLTIQSAQAWVLPIPIEQYVSYGVYDDDSICDAISYDPIIDYYTKGISQNQLKYRKGENALWNMPLLNKIVVEQVVQNCKAGQLFTFMGYKNFDLLLHGLRAPRGIAAKICNLSELKTEPMLEGLHLRYTCVIAEAKLKSAREWLASNPDVSLHNNQSKLQGNPKEVEDAILQGGQKAVQNKSNFCTGRLLGFPC
jgi:hypothetical protein